MIIKIIYYIFFYILSYSLKLNINCILFNSINNDNIISIKYMIKKTHINNLFLECKYIQPYLVKFTNNDSSKTLITIPEGYTVNNIFSLIDNCCLVNRESLESSMHVYKYKHLFLKEFSINYNWLEGYLFPDTYIFDTKDNPILFFNNVLNNFNNKAYIPLLKQYSTSDMHNIIIISSIIERESKFQYEQPIISGIIHNRIKSNMRLEIDATIQYIVEHKKRLLLDDIHLTSNYNTYMYSGLPSGPISNPGYRAIYSAIFPYKTKFYFYVARENGKHFFSKTFSKHNKYIIKIKKGIYT